MKAIFKRKFLDYFRLSHGFLFLGLFYGVTGYLFLKYNIMKGSPLFSALFQHVLFLMMFLIPLLTKDSFAKEFQQNTSEYLYSSPISITEWVFGNFFAAIAFLFLGLMILVAYTFVIRIYYIPNCIFILGNLIASFCSGMALISIGLFSSVITQRPIVAVLIYYGIIFGILALDTATTVSSLPFLKKILAPFTFTPKFHNFTLGIFSFSSIFFYLGLTLIFLLLCVSILTQKKWKVVAR